MNDRLKFRGMTLGGEWVYGNLAIIDKKIKPCRITIDKGYYISNKVGMPFAYPVRPETIGQCVGFKDKNYNLIYEGDIVELDDSVKAVIEWDNDDGCWNIKTSDTIYTFEDLYGNETRVIGNIHQNADLLEKNDG